MRYALQSYLHATNSPTPYQIQRIYEKKVCATFDFAPIKLWGHTNTKQTKLVAFDISYYNIRDQFMTTVSCFARTK